VPKPPKNALPDVVRAVYDQQTGVKTSITTVQCSVEYKGLPGGVVEKLLAAGETRREELQLSQISWRSRARCWCT